jgi:hypothetical protein
LALFRGFGFVRGWFCKVSKIGLSFLRKGFGKSKNRTFSASVLVSIKYFLVSAVVLGKVKFVFFQQVTWRK